MDEDSISDSMVQPGDSTSEFGWGDLLAVLVVAALLGLALWYVMYGLGPV